MKARSGPEEIAAALGGGPRVHRLYMRPRKPEEPPYLGELYVTVCEACDLPLVEGEPGSGPGPAWVHWRPEPYGHPLVEGSSVDNSGPSVDNSSEDGG